MDQLWICEGNPNGCQGDDCVQNRAPTMIIDALDTDKPKLYGGALRLFMKQDSDTPLRVHAGDPATLPKDRVYQTFVVTPNEDGSSTAYKIDLAP